MTVTMTTAMTIMTMINNYNSNNNDNHNIGTNKQQTAMRKNDKQQTTINHTTNTKQP